MEKTRRRILVMVVVEVMAPQLPPLLAAPEVQE
jgi:hypothetical protein